jgi:hypothetical protein
VGEEAQDRWRRRAGRCPVALGEGVADAEVADALAALFAAEQA